MKRLVILLVMLSAISLSGCAYNKESLMQYDYPYPAYYQTGYQYYYNPVVYPYLMGAGPYYPYPLP
jgi:hypothetical protein